MNCPSCDHANREGASFCAECATPLSVTVACPSCGRAAPRGQKFCDACGAAIAAHAAIASAARSALPLPATFAGGRHVALKGLGGTHVVHRLSWGEDAAA